MVVKLSVYIAAAFLGMCGALDESPSARILNYDFKNLGDGPYEFRFETSDGIKRDETAQLVPSIHDESQSVPLVRGSFAYTGPDGVVYEVNYVADESGFHPEGDHIKVPPFTPWVKGQPIDDGQYRHDTTGDYRPDSSETYQLPQEGEKIPNIELQKTPQYSSGESILDTYRTTPAPPTVTQKYLPSLAPQQQAQPTYTSGQSILDTYRSQPTTEYLPSLPTGRPESYYTTEAPVDRQQLINEALYTTPKPHPEIVLHSSSPKTVTIEQPQSNVPSAEQLQNYALQAQGIQGLNALAYNQHQNEYSTRFRRFDYNDLNPEIRELINSLK